MNKDKREQIFARLRDDNPNPVTELNYSNHYELLVAVALSAQATDVSVNKATKQLFRVANSPQAMLDLGLDQLKQHIKTIGLYNSKAKNVIMAAQMLVDLQLGYNYSDNLRLVIGSNNLLDEEPPFAIGNGDSDLYGYVGSVHNPRGRFFYSKLTYRF
ncbi:MAG TPA: hypothetical protein EYQ12_05275 [Oceanospirillaceae bacterium]|nr:hypothetical protein [Oceanospirillaceae bacterium]